MLQGYYTIPITDLVANDFICIVYRINTYPIVHAGFLHAFLNIIAVTPLLEKFEAEHGTLTSLAMFLGRKFTELASLA